MLRLVYKSKQLGYTVSISVNKLFYPSLLIDFHSVTSLYTKSSLTRTSTLTVALVPIHIDDENHCAGASAGDKTNASIILPAAAVLLGFKFLHSRLAPVESGRRPIVLSCGSQSTARRARSGHLSNYYYYTDRVEELIYT